MPPYSIVACIGLIIQKINSGTPQTRLYIQSLLPVHDQIEMYAGHVSHWQEVPLINKRLKALAEKEQVKYIDLFSHFKEKDSDKMNMQYTNDGLHLMGNGYIKWVEVIRPYVEE